MRKKKLEDNQIMDLIKSASDNVAQALIGRIRVLEQNVCSLLDYTGEAHRRISKIEKRKFRKAA